MIHSSGSRSISEKMDGQSVSVSCPMYRFARAHAPPSYPSLLLITCICLARRCFQPPSDEDDDGDALLGDLDGKSDQLKEIDSVNNNSANGINDNISSSTDGKDATKNDRDSLDRDPPTEQIRSLEEATAGDDEDAGSRAKKAAGGAGEGNGNSPCSIRIISGAVPNDVDSADSFDVDRRDEGLTQDVAVSTEVVNEQKRQPQQQHRPKEVAEEGCREDERAAEMSVDDGAHGERQRQQSSGVDGFAAAIIAAASAAGPPAAAVGTGVVACKGGQAGDEGSPTRAGQKQPGEEPGEEEDPDQEVDDESGGCSSQALEVAHAEGNDTNGQSWDPATVEVSPPASSHVGTGAIGTAAETHSSPVCSGQDGDGNRSSSGMGDSNSTFEIMPPTPPDVTHQDDQIGDKASKMPVPPCPPRHAEGSLGASEDGAVPLETPPGIDLASAGVDASHSIGPGAAEPLESPQDTALLVRKADRSGRQIVEESA